MHQGIAHIFRITAIASDRHHHALLSAIFKETAHCVAEITFR